MLAGVPVILFNRSQDDDRFSAITSDNILGGQKVARFLIAGGHKRIGYIAGWEGASTQRDRETGFVKELKQHGMSLYAREVGNFNVKMKLVRLPIKCLVANEDTRCCFCCQ